MKMTPHILSRLIRHRGGVAYIEFALVFPFLFLLLFGGIELSRYMLIIQKVEKAAGVMSSIVTQEDTAELAPPSGITRDQVVLNIFPNYNNVLTPFGCCGASPTVAVVMTSILRQAPNSIAGCTTGDEDACLRVRWQVGDVQGAGVGWSSAITGLGAADNAGMVALCTTITDTLSGDVVRRDCAEVAGLGGAVGTRGLSAAEVAGIRGMRANENMIVTEVFYQYQPIIEALLNGVTTATSPTPFSIAAAPVTRRIFAVPRSPDNLPDLPPDFPVDPSL